MINILSYVGMNMQSEVCLWTLLGLVRTIFDATLFKVNANLKQVWQMTMPEELSMPVQRVLRTMISGVMLVQCFTVYVYLASYIVLLYPVFLEERPTLVLPWLLLAAVRKLLCELTSLALGLGTCVLLGPARPPCIKFVVVKFTSIMPAFYMWMLVFSYYHALKVAAAFKTFPAVLPPNDHDYGLELAVRRRRTKSLLGEDQLRKKLVANFYGERTSSITDQAYLRTAIGLSSRIADLPDTSAEEVLPSEDTKPLTVSTTGWSDIGAYEDWFGSEVMIPRDTDRILEQIVLMLLRIGAYLKKEGLESILDSDILNSAVPVSWLQRDNIDCSAMNADDTDTPPLVGSSRGNMASYLREYPQIFMKRAGTDVPPTERKLASLKTVHSHVGSEDGNTSKSRKRVSPDTSTETLSVNVENVASKKKISISDIHSSEVETEKHKQQKPKRTLKSNDGKTKQKKQEPESQFKIKSDVPNGIHNELQVYKMSSSENKCVESNEAVSSRSSVQQSSKKIRENPPENVLDPPVIDYIQIPIIVQKNETSLKTSKESLVATAARTFVRQDAKSTGKSRDNLERKELEFRFKNDSNEIVTKENHGVCEESTNTNSSHAPNEHVNEIEKIENKDCESQSDYVIEIQYKAENKSKSHQISMNENNNEQEQNTSSPIVDETTSTQDTSKEETKASGSQSNNVLKNAHTCGGCHDDVSENDLDANKMLLKECINNVSNSNSSRDQQSTTQNSDEAESNETKSSPDKDLFNKPNTQ